MQYESSAELGWKVLSSFVVRGRQSCIALNRSVEVLRPYRSTRFVDGASDAP